MSRPIHMLLILGLLGALGIAEQEAYASDPTTADCLAASERSIALRNQHKLGDARTQLLRCSAASCPAEVRDECVRRVGEVNAAMPTVVFEAKDAAGNDLVPVKVTMDGQRIAERLDGTALALDPGEHAFTFESAGQASVQKQFAIHEGEKNRRERIVFNPAGVAAIAPPAAAPPSILVTTAGAQPSGSLGTQRILAIVAAGVGAIGLGVGIGYGLDSKSKHDQANRVCSGATCSDSNGVTLWKEAVSAGNVSTAAFIVGGVGLAASAALWFTAKPGSPQPGERGSTQVGFGPGALHLRGTW